MLTIPLNKTVKNIFTKRKLQKFFSSRMFASTETTRNQKTQKQETSKFISPLFIVSDNKSDILSAAANRNKMFLEALKGS